MCGEIWSDNSFCIVIMTENLRKLEGNKSQVTSLKRVYVSKILKKTFSSQVVLKLEKMFVK